MGAAVSCEDREMATKLAACNLCEAICGLELTIEDGHVTSIRGNPADPLSRGHICPKGVALADVYEDPDRLRRPGETGRQGRRRRVGGDLLGRGPRPHRRRARAQRQRARRDALGVYLGNPNAHSLGAQTHGVGMIKTLQDPQQVQRHLGRPAPPPVRRVAAVRPPADDPDRRHRPDLLLPRLRRQPDGLQRLADDRAGLPQPAPRAQGARRPDGGLRPAPHRDRQGRRRAPLRAARPPTRWCCWRWCTCSSRRD